MASVKNTRRRAVTQLGLERALSVPENGTDRPLQSHHAYSVAGFVEAARFFWAGSCSPSSDLSETSVDAMKANLPHFLVI